jgi:hypothetical protein
MTTCPVSLIITLVSPQLIICDEESKPFRVVSFSGFSSSIYTLSLTSVNPSPIASVGFSPPNVAAK